MAKPFNMNSINKGKQTAGASLTEAEISIYRTLPANKIKENPHNVYWALDDTEEDLEYLADSIKANGLMEPVAVSAHKDGSYLILSGHRRYKALTEKLNRTMIPCLVYETLNPQQELDMLYAANDTQRPELNPLTKIKCISHFITSCQEMMEKGEMTVGGIAVTSVHSTLFAEHLQDKLKISERQARKYIQVKENLTEEELERFHNGEITLHGALEIIRKRDSEKEAKAQNKTNKQKPKIEKTVRKKEYTELQKLAMKMNRLTYKYTNSRTGKETIDTEISNKEVIKKLFDYEELGYTPEELKSIVRKYEDNK